jgi:hypothetical protein
MSTPDVSSSRKAPFMDEHELFMETEVFYGSLVRSLAALARDDQKLRDVLESLSTEELRTFADSTSRINYEAEAWLY